ncbi:diaminopimelate decarboxylase [Fusibacter sp. JL216-2]|uniref:diaminopimelate decarboxylase n=1 Tax=Fusibacter sp. JL216-2 TaxID=3071453 RepID=UPI003D332723
MLTPTNLLFDNCDTVALAKEYGTPLLMISQSRLEEKSKEIHKDFLDKYNHVQAVYASKAFLNTAMCKLVEKYGMGLDVVSGGELYVAQTANFPMRNIVFHGNNKSYEELSQAVDLQVGRIIVDNPSELRMLEKICAHKNTRVSVLFRITPEVSSRTHAYIATADRDSKFGIPLEQVVDEYTYAGRSNFIDPLGLHFHVGSQLQSNTSHLNALEVVLKLAEDIAKAGFQISELNTGGGFGVRYTESDTEMSLKDFTDPIMNKITTWSQGSGHPMPRVIIEPGRWFIANAGLTIYEIGSVKHIPNVRTYVSVNGGIPDNIRPALYTAKYSAQIANKKDREHGELVTVAGKCCESGDILIRDIELDSPSRGDFLAVFGTGAYTESMSSNYNYLPRPAVLLLNKGEAHLIRRRESYADLVRRDLVPQYLIE